jgi:hypothetical protein
MIKAVMFAALFTGFIYTAQFLSVNPPQLNLMASINQDDDFLEFWA